MPQTMLLQWIMNSLAQVEAAAPTSPVPELWHWLAFGAMVVVFLVFDLAVFHRQSHEPTLRESTIWTAVWCSAALAFNAFIWWWRGTQFAVEFLTGYLIEWSLSMDNVFVFWVIFNVFKVPLKYQYRVLFWGILGAIIMRLTFVLVGAALLEHFAWMMWIFGAFLIFTGVKLAMSGDEKPDVEHNLLLRLTRKFFPVSCTDQGQRFFAVENGRRCMTPLFLVLIVVESTDVVFAVDSVPAIFGVTKDPFTVFTSNIFAILGLRALYFLLAGVVDMFRYLNYGLSAVLVFVGSKMVAEYWLHDWLGLKEDQHLIPAHVSLLIIVAILATAVIASIIAKRREDRLGQSLPHVVK